MIKGSCCCGEVRFELDKEPEFLVICHCSRCRKVGASAFVMVKKDSLNISAGREAIATFEPTPPFNYPRCFCSKCGSALGEILTDEDLIPISANCLDDEINLTVRFHEHVNSKPKWLTISDTEKQFPENPHR